MLYVTAKGIKGCSDKDDKNNLRPGEKKTFMRRETEKISGVYGGRELNKKGCDKTSCCQGCGKGQRGNGEKEPRRCELARACGQWCCRACSGRRQAGWWQRQGHREAARNPARAEEVTWAPKGRDTR